MLKSGIDTEFDRTEDYMIIRIKGLFDYETLLYAFDQAVNDDKFQLGMRRIWD